MTSTNVKDFKLFLSRIDKENLKNCWFFPLRQDNKSPDVAPGTRLKGNEAYRLSVKDCIARLKSGKNIGIYALTGGIMFLDLDVENNKILASKELMSNLNPTLTIKSRNGGRQYYYINEGIYANQLLKENNIVIGELRTNWHYVVSPGSYVPVDQNNHDGDGTYRIFTDEKINIFPGIPGIDLKPLTEEQKTTTTFNIPKPDNIISHSKHLRELAQKGVCNRKIRKRIVV